MFNPKIFHLLLFTVIIFIGFIPDNKREVEGHNNGTVADISLIEGQFLYVGIENQIKVRICGYSPERIEARIQMGGKLIIVGDGSYSVIPDGSERIINFQFFDKNQKNNRRLIAEKKFQIRQLPKPEVVFGGYMRDPEITKNELLTQTQVYANLSEGFPLEGLKYKVLGYTYTLVSKVGEIYNENIRGGNVTQTMRKSFLEAKTGDLIVISNVNVIGPDSLKRWVSAS